MRKVLFGLLATLPIGLFVVTLAQFSVNVPWFDDFDPFPDFLRKWVNSTDLLTQLQLIFQPNNEHRMIFGKLGALVYYWLFGELNFTFLHWLGFGFTLGTLAIFIGVFRQQKIEWEYLIPLLFFLFQLQYHMTSLWAITALQHLPVIFFVSLTSYLLSKQRFGWAVLAGFCANFAMSNGIFVWPAGMIILFAQGRYKLLTTWVVAGITAVFLYFKGMQTLNNESSFSYFLQHPHQTFFGFFTFIGGLFDFFPDRSTLERSVLPTIGGMVMVGALVVALVKVWKLFREHTLVRQEALLFLLGVSTYLLANASVIALLRPRFGYFVMIVSNYKIYPALFLMVIYGFYLVLYRQRTPKNHVKIALAVGVGIWGLSLLHYWPTINERRKTLLTDAFNQEHNGFGLGFIPNTPAAKYIDSLMKFNVQRGIYHYPTSLEPVVQSLQKPTGFPIQPQLEYQAEGLLIREETYSFTPEINGALYIYLQSNHRHYLFKLEPTLYTGRNWLKRYASGTSLVIPYAAVEPGSYHMQFVLVRKNKPQSTHYQTIEWKKKA